MSWWAIRDPKARARAKQQSDPPPFAPLLDNSSPGPRPEEIKDYGSKIKIMTRFYALRDHGGSRAFIGRLGQYRIPPLPPGCKVQVTKREAIVTGPYGSEMEFHFGDYDFVWRELYEILAYRENRLHEQRRKNYEN